MTKDMTHEEMVDALKYALAVSESEGGRFLELGCRTAKAVLAALSSPCAEICPSCRAPLWIKRGIKVRRRGLEHIGTITDIGEGYDNEPWRYAVVFEDGIRLWIAPHELVPADEPQGGAND